MSSQFFQDSPEASLLTPVHADKIRLRSLLRSRRRALSDQEQQSHSRALARLFTCSTLFLRCRRIALYLASDGEIDPLLLGDRAAHAGKQLYLPVLRGNTHNKLWFAEYRSGDRLKCNRFNIQQPDIRRRPPVSPWGLDLILLPLVGFDDKGNRIGMGGGFYDRTLAYLNHRVHWQRPLLIGVAHECQKLPFIDPQPWDIALDGVISERNFYLITTEK